MSSIIVFTYQTVRIFQLRMGREGVLFSKGLKILAVVGFNNGVLINIEVQDESSKKYRYFYLRGNVKHRNSHSSGYKR